MTREALQTTILLIDPKLSEKLEMKIFIPTENEIVYMQVGTGDQLDGECDENGVPYDGYIDYSISKWSDTSGFFEEHDGGIFEFVSNRHDEMYGVLTNRCFDTLLDIYGSEVVESENFTVQILADAK